MKTIAKHARVRAQRKYCCALYSAIKLVLQLFRRERSFRHSMAAFVFNNNTLISLCVQYTFVCTLCCAHAHVIHTFIVIINNAIAKRRRAAAASNMSADFLGMLLTLKDKDTGAALETDEVAVSYAHTYTHREREREREILRCCSYILQQ